MKISNTSVRRLSVGALLGAAAVSMAVAPAASAAPDCNPDAVAGTVSSVTGAASDYLGSHPGANQVVQAAYTQPRADAAAEIRSYFTANPQEYHELRGILAPIGDTQRQCNVSVLSPELASAYSEFMAG